MAWPSDPKQREALMRDLGMRLKDDMMDALLYGTGFTHTKAQKSPSGYTVGDPVTINLREIWNGEERHDGNLVITLDPSEYRRVK